MRPLAAFIMRGRVHAVLAAGVSAMLVLFLPALGILSSAAIALVTLRNGANDGIATIVMAGLACMLCAYAIFNDVSVVLLFVLVLWLPVWGLGLLLRISRSLSLTIQAALGFGLILLGVLHLSIDGMQQRWVQLLQPLIDELLRTGLLAADDRTAFMQNLVLLMGGILAGGVYLQLLLSLFLARAWQSQLYNPGGFANEFNSLKVHEGWVIVTLAVVVFGWLQIATIASVTTNLLLLLMPLWLVQGLAVMHGVAFQANLSIGWLVAVYLLLVLMTIPVVLLMTFIGLVDPLIDIRNLLRHKSSSDR